MKLTSIDHGLEVGDGPLRFASGGTLPDGVEAGVDYYVVGVERNVFQLGRLPWYRRAWRWLRSLWRRLAS